MSDVTERKMDIILEMKGGIDSMVKQISSAAYEVEQGKFSRVRPVEDTLNTWMTKYSGLLPETIIDSVGSLSSRIRAWKLGNGQTDTVGGMVNGPGAVALISRRVSSESIGG
jgi:hypothetical protein